MAHIYFYLAPSSQPAYRPSYPLIAFSILLSVITLIRVWLNSQRGFDGEQISATIKLELTNVVGAANSNELDHNFAYALPGRGSGSRFPGFSDNMHADIPFYESDSVSAILPVSNRSLKNLWRHMDTLVSERSSVSAVILVCATELVPFAVDMLDTGNHATYLDISYYPWEEGLDENSAVLAAVAQVSTEYLLVLSSDGLDGLHTGLQEQILSHPLFVDMPVGFCGGSTINSSTHATCVVPKPESQSSSFLLPPMIIPSSLIYSLNTTFSARHDIWPALGNAISPSGHGGVVQENVDDTLEEWCHSQCRKYGLAVGDDNIFEKCSLKEDIPGSVAASPMTNSPQSYSLGIILPTLEDLKHFSSAACAFIKRDISTRVLILSKETNHNIAPDSSFPWFHDQLTSNICQISYSALYSPKNEFANAEPVNHWISSINDSLSAIIYGAQDDILSELDVVLQKQQELGAAVIKIPRSDIPFCDWIGSLSLAELRHWHSPQMEVVVITDDRPNSLSRLLRSLNNAMYFGDKVQIRINMEQTADLTTRKIVSSFLWKHGDVFVHHRVIHAGLLVAIVESWYPVSNDSYGIVLEDDVELSPLFYAWAKLAVLRYRYGNSENISPTLYGVSLYQQKNIELRPEGRKPFDARSLFDSYGYPHRNTPYLSQIPCSWGAVYFPEHWREFHSFLILRFSEAWISLEEHIVPHIRSNKWKKSWKKYFIELVHLRGYAMLYPNYNDFVSLSTNHLETGSHVKDEPKHIYDRKKQLFTLPLMTIPEVNEGEIHATGLLDIPDEHLPVWSDLPVLDLLGGVSSEQEIEERGQARQKELAHCETRGSLVSQRRAFAASELFTCVEEDIHSETMDYHVDYGF